MRRADSVMRKGIPMKPMSSAGVRCCVVILSFAAADAFVASASAEESLRQVISAYRTESNDLRHAGLDAAERTEFLERWLALFDEEIPLATDRDDEIIARGIRVSLLNSLERLEESEAEAVFLAEATGPDDAQMRLFWTLVAGEIASIRAAMEGGGPEDRSAAILYFEQAMQQSKGPEPERVEARARLGAKLVICMYNKAKLELDAGMYSDAADSLEYALDVLRNDCAGAVRDIVIHARYTEEFLLHHRAIAFALDGDRASLVQALEELRAIENPEKPLGRRVVDAAMIMQHHSRDSAELLLRVLTDDFHDAAAGQADARCLLAQMAGLSDTAMSERLIHLESAVAHLDAGDTTELDTSPDALRSHLVTQLINVYYEKHVADRARFWCEYFLDRYDETHPRHAYVVQRLERLNDRGE